MHHTNSQNEARVLMRHTNSQMYLCTPIHSTCILTSKYTAAYATAIGQCTITHCNTLQHTATHFKIHSRVRHCPMAVHYNTLQHTATHCNTLQHTATHCNIPSRVRHCPVASQHNTLQHNTATHFNLLQRTATYTAANAAAEWMCQDFCLATCTDQEAVLVG